MKDYFREFIIPQAGQALPNPANVASSLAGYLNGGVESTTPIKTHLIWALVAGGSVCLTWKISEFWTKYKLIRDKTSITL